MDTIQKDAGELMVWIYKEYVGSEDGFITIGSDSVVKETKWNVGRVNRAVDYIKKSELIEMEGGIGGFIILGLTPKGVETVEDSGKFKGAFGFGVNLGVVSLSWQSK